MNKNTLVQDLSAGIVVFLVALPLCLGISLASGAPFYSGIIAGVVGGIVIGLLSSSRFSVSGPAAGLAALVLSAITNIGDFSLFLCAIVIAGFIQVLIGSFKLGGIAVYFPSSVIKGMLTSIGVLIIAKQLIHAFGYKADSGKNVFINGNSDNAFVSFIKDIHPGTVIICGLSIFIILIWDIPKIKKTVKFIPGALVAVIVSVLLNQYFILSNSPLAVDSAYSVNLIPITSVNDLNNVFVFPDWSGFLNSEVVITGIVIAIIASLETLLSIEAVDNIDPDRNVTNVNRELVAQGIGNTVSGLIGGLPITSVIVRSSANIDAGAKSKISAIVHGVLLVLCVVLIPGIINKIPLASLAAILLVTGYKLAKLSTFKVMYNKGKYQFVPFILTFSTVLMIDLFGLIPHFKGEGLLIGVMVGLISAAGAVLHGNLKNSYYFHKENHHEGDRVLIHLSEEVSFLNKASIKQTLHHIPEKSSVVIDATSTMYIDQDVLEIIKEFRDIKSPLKKIKCELKGFKEVYQINNEYYVHSQH